MLHQLSKENAKTRFRFLDTLVDLLNRAKEIRLHRGRSRDILDEFNRNSAKLGDVAAETNNVYDDNNLFVKVNLYVLLGAIVFVLPRHVDLGAELMAKIVATLLFLWGSVQLGLSPYSAFVQSNEATVHVSSANDISYASVTSNPFIELVVAYDQAFFDAAFGVGSSDALLALPEMYPRGTLQHVGK